MIVTDITEWNKKKYKVYVDYEFAFVLYKGELHKYKLRKGEVITDEIYQEIRDGMLLKRARLRAMNLLTKRPYTEEGLRQKLREGLYPLECIDGAIAYVKSFGYVDDAAYARDYILYHRETQSRRSMEQKLITKGIDSRIIQNVLEEVCEDADDEVEMRQIRTLLQKKYKGIIPSKPEEKMKMMSYFMRKGYSTEQIKKVLAEIDLEDLYKFE